MMKARRTDLNGDPQGAFVEKGRVLRAIEGVPYWIHDGWEALEVSQLSHQLPYLEVGAGVVFTRLPEGVMVLHQIRSVHQHRPTHAPVRINDSVILENGEASIELKDDGRIQLKVNETQLVLDNQGNLLCQSGQIHFSAEDKLILRAPDGQVHLTTK